MVEKQVDKVGKQINSQEMLIIRCKPVKVFCGRMVQELLIVVEHLPVG